MLQQFYPRAPLDSLANSATKELLPTECNQGKVFTRVSGISSDIFQEEDEEIDFSLIWTQPPYSRLSSFSPPTKVAFLGSQSSHLEVGPLPALKEEKVSWVQSRIKVNHIRVSCSSSRLCPQGHLSLRPGYCFSVFHLTPGPLRIMQIQH